MNQEPLLINNDLDAVYTKIKADVKGQMVQSYLGVPIITGSKSIGVISIQSTELKNRLLRSTAQNYPQTRNDGKC